jgi:hypothetical protein
VYVYRGGRLVASAVSPAPDEQLTLADPVPGHYTVYVADAESARRRPTTATFTGWVLRRAARNPSASLTSRTAVTGGRAFSVALTWSGLSPARRWFGQIDYEHSAAVSYLTIR